VHGGNQASRSMGGVFKASMKPFTSIAHPGGWLSSRSSSHNNVSALTSISGSNSPYQTPYLQQYHSQQHQQREREREREREQQQAQAVQTPSVSTPGGAGGLRVQTADPTTPGGSSLLHRAFTEVPDYQVASRGFIGGVPPLESMRGLPSYEETQGSSGPGTPAMESLSSPVTPPQSSHPGSPHLSRRRSPRMSYSLPVSPRLG
jgi:arrestin-related trafficking adapter 4/5/7